jgi:hypothetical protein
MLMLLQSRHEEFEEKRRRQLEEEEEAARRAAEFKVGLHQLRCVLRASCVVQGCNNHYYTGSIYLRLCTSLASTLTCSHYCRIYTCMLGITC